MKPDTIKRLIDEGKSSDEIRILLIQHASLETTKSRLVREEQEETKRHSEAIKANKEGWRQFRLTCTHIETTFYPDASGNNDSYTSCDLCGKEL